MSETISQIDTIDTPIIGSQGQSNVAPNGQSVSASAAPFSDTDYTAIFAVVQELTPLVVGGSGYEANIGDGGGGSATLSMMNDTFGTADDPMTESFILDGSAYGGSLSGAADALVGDLQGYSAADIRIALSVEAGLGWPQPVPGSSSASIEGSTLSSAGTISLEVSSPFDPEFSGNTSLTIGGNDLTASGGVSVELSNGTLDFANNVVNVGTGFFALDLFPFPGNGESAPLASSGLNFSGNHFVGSGSATLDLTIPYDPPGLSSVTIDTLAGDISIGGSVANMLTGFDTFSVSGTLGTATGSSLDFVVGAGTYTVDYAGPGVISFTPQSGSVIVNGFGAGGSDVLDLTAFGAALDAQDIASDTTIDGGDTFVDIPNAGSIELAGYTGGLATADLLFSTACYAAGTGILVERSGVVGEIAVESLRVGDRAVTLSGGRRPIVWLGHRDVSCRDHPRPHAVLPVRIAAGAFAPGVPARDVLVSPDHAVFAAGVLIPAHLLINGASIRQEDAEAVAYHHVELDRHDVLLADGLPAESYLDTGNRAMFANGATAPQGIRGAREASGAWAHEACAPLVEDGDMLQQVRRAVAERAAALGCGGSPVFDMEIVAAGRVAATLPAEAEILRLVSPSVRIAQDRRRIGALLRGVRIDHVPVALDHGRVWSSGFHEVERHGEQAVRWTNGSAMMLIGRGNGQRRIEVDVAAVAAGAMAA